MKALHCHVGFVFRIFRQEQRENIFEDVSERRREHGIYAGAFKKAR